VKQPWGIIKVVEFYFLVIWILNLKIDFECRSLQKRVFSFYGTQYVCCSGHLVSGIDTVILGNFT